MVLTKDIQKSILTFVQQQPRSVQEIAKHIHKNWRTADSYVQKLTEEESIATKTFRNGTKGALKIVYWNATEKTNATEFQERLFTQIQNGRHKQDFSPLDIYNYVSEEKRSARCGSYNVSNELGNQDLVQFLKSTQKSLLIFTGNCSFVSLIEHNTPILSVLQELAEKGVNIHVLTRVDFSSLKNLQQLLSINYATGKQSIEVRHCEQPIRGFIVDETAVRLKEALNPQSYGYGELPPDVRVILYDIRDYEWVHWLKNVFNTLYRTSISCQKRMKDIQSIRMQEKQSMLTM